MGRVTQVQYSDQTQSFQYDQGTNGQGRLTQVTDASGSTAYGYDALGRILSKQQTVAGQSKTVSYSYTNGQLTNLTTPSGHTISYSYTHGKPTGITVNGQALLSNVLYSSFGPTRGWTWGNNTLTVREFDQDGQLTTLDSAGLSTYTYHPDGTNASITHDSSANLNLPTGNTSLAVSATSNRIDNTTGTLNQTYSYDAAGNTTSDGSKSFTYNDAGRMISATNVGLTTTYLTNALGQRAQKSNANGTTNFVYDESGHLLGEYDQAGNLIQEIVWLNDIPVASIRIDQGGSTAGVFYIHTDHLNAPSKITRPSDNQVIWRWDHDPFGNGTPNQDPDGNGLQLTMNLRFPGQYADAETGLLYNMARYYDPATGRYITSDPIGLAGGQFSTYAYVGGNPISFIDPFGLEATSCTPWDNIVDEPIEQVCPECYALGAGRLLYAGLAKTIPYLAAGLEESAMAQAAYANAARNSLKDLFRGPLAPLFSGVRQPSFAETLVKYGSNPSAIIDAAARTNTAINAVGATGVGLGAGVDAVNSRRGKP